MQYSTAEKRRVFLAYRALFAGKNALLRQSKAIRKLMQTHESSFQPLIRDFGCDKIVIILGDLLARQIFQSELRARLEFPELFQTSPAQDEQRATSEKDAERAESEVLEEVASLQSKGKEPIGDGTKREDACGASPEVTSGSSTSDDAVSSKVSSLYPLYLPYRAQHVILTAVQHLLEECCFDFATTWLPLKLQDHGWDCAEAAELTKWIRTLAQSCGHFPNEALDVDKGTTANEVLFSTNDLRHSAVHRLPTSAQDISQMIKSALSLAKTLRDPLRAAQLEELHREMEDRIKDMELNKNFLEAKLDEGLREIWRQREELDKREKDLVATTLREGQENKSLIGSLLEESLVEILGGRVTAGHAEPKLEKKDNGKVPKVSDSVTQMAFGVGLRHCWWLGIKIMSYGKACVAQWIPWA